ncbi:MAG: hypothetical protein A2V66_07185 [Ignavibacteria bacterium RBG_13_36_8]|nr:MAG: hypothetical protein A2V66_07185 [Ignavibacteria bacterium RBG_13_36_8]
MEEQIAGTSTIEIIDLIMRIFLIFLILAIFLFAGIKLIKSKYWEPLLKKLDTMLDEGKKKKWSSPRFNLFTTIIASNVAVWGIFFFLCIWEGEFVEIPASVLALYGTANGLAGIIKNWSKSEETKQIDKE